MSGAASSGDLVASLVLRLNDQLTGPLDKIEARLAALGDIGRRITAGGLGAAGEIMDRVKAAAGGMAEDIAKAGPAAERASAGVGKLTGALEKLRENGFKPLKRTIEEAMAPLDKLDRTKWSAGPMSSAEGVAGALNRARPKVAAYGGRVAGAVGGLGHATEHAAGAAFGAAATGFGLVEPIREAAKYDNTLRHIAITAGLAGEAADKMVRSMGEDLDQLARKTGQTGEALAEAMGYFGREGIALPEARQLTGTVAKIATAYNATPEAVAHTAFALRENLHVGPQDMNGALASLALAGKQADFPFEQLAQFLPNIAPAAGMLGVQGRSGVNSLGAMLAISRKSSATPGEASTNMGDFINTITAPVTRKHFAAMGVDLKKLVEGANAKGEDPIMAVLSKLKEMGKTGAFDLGTIFHNQQTKAFAVAMLQHLDEYKEVKKKLDAVDDTLLDKDYAEGSKSMQVGLTKADEALRQIIRRLGYGFAPVLAIAAAGMGHLVAGMDWLHNTAPGASDAVLFAVGSMLALATGVGLVGAVAPIAGRGLGVLDAVMGLSEGASKRLLISLVRLPFRAVGGMVRFLLSPLRALGWLFGFVGVGATLMGGLIVGAIAVVIGSFLDIYNHWARFRAFFGESGHGIMEELRGIGSAIVDAFTGNWSRIGGDLKRALSGVVDVFAGLGRVVMALLGDFGSAVNGFFGGMPGRIVASIAATWHEVVDFLSNKIAELGKVFENSAVGRMLSGAGAAASQAGAAEGGIDEPAPSASGVATGKPASGASSKDTLHVTVEAAPGTAVTKVESTRPVRQVQARPTASRGAMTTRN